MIHNIHVKEFTLDDWQSVRHFQDLIQIYPQSVHVDFEQTMEPFAAQSLVNPALGLFLLKGNLFDEELGVDFPAVIGLSTVQVIGNPISTGDVYHCYIRGTFILPSVGMKKVPVPSQAGKILLTHVNEWAKARGCTNICINVRMDGAVKGYERKYGFEPYHYVLGKKVE